MCLLPGSRPATQLSCTGKANCIAYAIAGNGYRGMWSMEYYQHISERDARGRARGARSAANQANHATSAGMRDHRSIVDIAPTQRSRHLARHLTNHLAHRAARTRASTARTREGTQRSCWGVSQPGRLACAMRACALNLPKWGVVTGSSCRLQLAERERMTSDAVSVADGPQRQPGDDTLAAVPSCGSWHGTGNAYLVSKVGI